LILLLFGGSFDPVHNGHVAMWRAAVAALQPAKTLLIPVGNAWQKGRLPYASAEQRTAMLRLAFPEVQIDERELRREGATYTVDTLWELARAYPNYTRYWLLGGDSYAHLDTWHEAHTLATLATFAVVRRAGEELTRPNGNFCAREIECTPPAVSSTHIRALCAQMRAADKQVSSAASATLREMVPAAVYDYIQQQQLYPPT
jgi:nicotinate-nucleotide adenylyltransferase